MMHRQRGHDDAQCPRCGCDEFSEHIWVCNGNKHEFWEKSMKALVELLVNTDTHPSMA